MSTQISWAGVKSHVKRRPEWPCATPAVQRFNLGEAKSPLKWLQGHAWRLQDNSGAELVPIIGGQLRCLKQSPLKHTHFVRSTIARGQRLMVDSLAGAAGYDDVALLTKTMWWSRRPSPRPPFIFNPHRSPPGRRLHRDKVSRSSVVSRRKKWLLLEAAECVDAPISLHVFTTGRWTACRRRRGGGADGEKEEKMMRSAKLLPEEETRRKSQFTVKMQAL